MRTGTDNYNPVVICIQTAVGKKKKELQDRSKLWAVGERVLRYFSDVSTKTNGSSPSVGSF